MNSVYVTTTKVLKALSDPKRLRIVHMLSKREMCASEILEAFHITQPTLSHDMKVLVEANVINGRKIGKNMYYTLNIDTWNETRNQLNDLMKIEDMEAYQKTMKEVDYDF